MTLLLDTHTFLWLIEGSPRLSPAAQAAIHDPGNDAVISVASVWELAIKVGNGKLRLQDPLDVFVTRWTGSYGVRLLPIQASHAWAVATLPNHHRDPFDRILIAQAQIDKMTIVTADAHFSSYAVSLLW